MKKVEVDIHDPKALTLLDNLADLGLISIKRTSDEGFLSMVSKLRNQAEHSIPSREDLRKEVQLVMRSIIYSSKEIRNSML